MLAVPIARLVAGSAFSPVIVPGDRSVVYISLEGGAQSPWIVPIEGGAPSQLTKTFANPNGHDVTPDGKQLLFGTLAARGPALMICELAACVPQPLASVAPVGFPEWVLDGKAVAGVLAEDQAINLWIQPIDGKPRYQVTHFADDLHIWSAAWSGKRFALVRGRVKNDIVLFRGLGK